MEGVGRRGVVGEDAEEEDKGIVASGIRFVVEGFDEGNHALIAVVGI